MDKETELRHALQRLISALKPALSYKGIDLAEIRQAVAQGKRALAAKPETAPPSVTEDKQ